MERSEPGLDHAPTGFVSIDGKGTRIMVRRGYELYAPLLAPAGTAVAHQLAERFVSGGRQPHPVVRLPNGEHILIRGYRRGGLVGKVNRRLYFYGRRAVQELHATTRAADAGVRVPEIIAAAEERAGPGYTATIASRWIEGAVDAVEYLTTATPTERLDLLHEAGRQIALMHAAGIAHPDLNLRNILVVRTTDPAAPPSTPDIYLIDFDRARLSPHPTPQLRRARDLRRLGRSARKLGLPLEDENGWSALRTGYGAGWPLTGRGYRASASETLSTT